MSSLIRHTNYIKSDIIELSSNLNNENFKVQKQKKQIKHDKSFTDSTSNHSTVGFVSKKLVEESNELKVKKKKHKSNEIADITLDTNSYFNNENLEVQTPKKKKKHNSFSLDSSSNYSTDGFVSKKLIEESNELKVKKKKHKSNEIADTILETNSYFNNEDLEIQTPKKKKKHNSFSLDSSSNYSTDGFVSKKLVEKSNELKVKKKKHKSNEIADTILETNSYFNNEDLEIQTPKKKKKHNSFSLDSTFNYSTDGFVPKKLVEESNELKVKKKKHKSNDIVDTILETNSYFNNEDLEIQTPKKKKKHNSFSLDSTFNYSTDGFVSKKLVEESNELKVKKKKHKSNEIADTILETNSYFNNEDLETQKPKKKKKHDRNSIEPTSNNSTDAFVSKKLAEESNEIKVKKKKHKSNEISDTILETNSYSNTVDLETQKPKKKKKHDKNSVESTSNNSIDAVVSKKLVEESNEIKVKKKKHKSNQIADTTLETNCYFNNEDLETRKPKKKKKHNRLSIESTFQFSKQNSSDAFVTKKQVEESDISKIKKKKLKSNEIADTTLHSKSYFNNENLETQKPNKGKNHDRYSVESSLNFSINDNLCKKLIGESTEDTFSNRFNEKKRKNLEIVNTSLIDNNFLNNEYLKPQEPKIEVYDNSLDCTYSCALKKKSPLQTKRKCIKSIPDSGSYDHVISKKKNNELNAITNIGQNISSWQQNVIEYKKEFDETFNNSSNNMNKSTLNESNLPTIFENGSDIIDLHSQKCNVLKEILQAISTYELENSSTTENKVYLDVFDLINQVIDSKSSILNEQDLKIIHNIFSKFMKKMVNLENQLVTQSDIILLKGIGERIFEKIVVKYEKSKIMENNLHIELPIESQNIKIHHIETSLTGKHDKEQINLMHKLNPAFKFNSRFSKEEDNIIHKYWSKFEQEYNISDPSPFLPFKGMNKLSLPPKIIMKFVRYISAGLPNRLLSSVYNRFKVLYTKQENKLSFSEEEDKLIMIVDNCDAIKNKISLLNTLLNRSKGQIWRRIHTFKMKPLRGKNITWDIYKLRELFRKVLLETNTKNWNDLKEIKIKIDTWIKISDHFDKAINYEKCQTQWNFLKTRLFCEKPIKYSTIRVMLLESLLEENPKDWSETHWVKITNKLFPGAHTKVIHTIFFWWVNLKVPIELRKNVRATLKYLSENCLDAEIQKIKTGKERVLSRLTVVDNDTLVEVK